MEDTAEVAPLRIGTLGASRDRARAEKFDQRPTYEALLGWR